MLLSTGSSCVPKVVNSSCGSDHSRKRCALTPTDWKTHDAISITTALHDLGVHQLKTALADKHVGAVEVAQHFLDRANAHADLGAFVAINPEVTLAQARAADARIANGNRRRLWTACHWRTRTSSSPRTSHHRRFAHAAGLPLAV